ncbi:hypothetical protein ACFZAM_05160 [Streptomyces sp. NPDC008079]|uniref:hypothetical protein n=1 Tax=Streptomyces sp. NPDC008079 TaxID=3364806 RepID=UPI0036E70BB8
MFSNKRKQEAQARADQLRAETRASKQGLIRRAKADAAAASADVDVWTRRIQENGDYTASKDFAVRERGNARARLRAAQQREEYIRRNFGG